MGVTQVGWGTGVARPVMRRAVKAAGRVGAKSMALTVDRCYSPAHKFFGGWGFIEFSARRTWIVTSAPAEG